MKIAYLVLAHDHPQHLRRLVRRLAHGDAGVFVHVDRRSPAAVLAALEGERVHVARRRVDVHWGDWSIVDATLGLLREALAARPPYDRFVLLSGADYPVRPAREIERFFAAHPHDEFLHLVAMPSEAEHKPLSRLTRWHARPGSRAARLARAALVRARLLAPERDVRRGLAGMAPYAGSQWWALTRTACAHAVEFADRERRVVRFFEHSHCPDEMFFQTLLANTPLRAHVRPSVTYADWSAAGRSPAWLGDRHVERLLDGVHGMLFARKFADAAAPLVDRIDHALAEAESREYVVQRPSSGVTTTLS